MPPHTLVQNQTVFPSSDEPVAVIACLEPADWVGRHHAVHQPLFEGDDSPDCPLIAFGFDHPDEIEFIDAKWFAQTGMSIEELESRAFGNVWARPAEWRVVPLGRPPGMEGEPFTVLDCLDEGASERILHHAFMRRAHDILQTPELLAAIPRRGVLLCVDGRNRDDAIKGLAVIVFDQYESGESAPITDLLFEIRDGRIDGSIRVVVTGGSSHTPSAGAASEPDSFREPDPIQPAGLFARPAAADVGKDGLTSGARIGLMLLVLCLLSLLIRGVS